MARGRRLGARAIVIGRPSGDPTRWVGYILDQDRAQYANYSGTGNALNANQPVVRRMIIDRLRYWVAEMHVDGFRFDLASTLAQDETGRPLENPPVLWYIESDPVLAGTKLIAEAWDAAGLYQVGTFIGDSWKEWNGRLRDDIRRFVKGGRNTVRLLTQRALGSPDNGCVLRSAGAGDAIPCDAAFRGGVVFAN